ncbi:MAG: DUF5337 family protein [Rubricella sp.]
MDERERSLLRQGRTATIVIVVAFSLWVLLNLIGGRLGLDPRYAFLADFAAMAALAWSVIVLLRIRRARAEHRD